VLATKNAAVIHFFINSILDQNYTSLC